MLDKIFARIEKFVPEKWRWILKHEGVRRYGANTGWMFGGQMFSLLVSFFIGAWIARYLGPENYGVLSYALSFAGLFAFIASLGIDGVLGREIVKFPEKRDDLLGTSFVLKIIGGLTAFALVCVAAILFENNFLIRILIILFGLSFILQAIGVISIFFQSKVEAKQTIKAQFFAMIISSLLKIFLILTHLGVIWLMLIYVLDAVWSGLGLLFVYRQAGLKINNWKFSANLAISILKDSWPLMLSGAATFIYMKIDQVMIGQMLDNESVGLYAVAIKLSEVWYFIPGIICASLFPALINARQLDIKKYYQRLKNLYLFMFFLALAISILVTIIAKPLIIILFGSAYISSIPILQIYIWSSIGIFVGAAVSQYLIAENMMKTVFVTSILGMLANVILNFILIPKTGLLGAALASLISYIATPFLILLFVGLLKNRKL
ncbi:MAG: flippase [Patescibacteria group bacterium]|jgi:O-antigen/teichoic acid export membrane protein